LTTTKKVYAGNNKCFSSQFYCSRSDLEGG